MTLQDFHALAMASGHPPSRRDSLAEQHAALRPAIHTAEPISAGLLHAGMGQVKHSTHPAGVLRTPVKHMDSVLL